MIKPLKKTTLVDKIINALIEMIDNHELSPGEKIMSERLLAEKFNVSRTSLREALKSLSYAQLIEIIPGSGSYLTNDINIIQSIKNRHNTIVVKKQYDFNQVYESRKLFEPQITKLAAENANEKDIAALKKSFDLLDYFLKENKTIEYQREDLNFHKIIVRATHNDVIYNSYSKTLNYLLDIIPTLDHILKVHDEHRKLLLAISENNADKAVKYCLKHLDTLGKNLEEQLI